MAGLLALLSACAGNAPVHSPSGTETPPAARPGLKALAATNAATLRASQHPFFLLDDNSAMLSLAENWEQRTAPDNPWARNPFDELPELAASEEETATTVDGEGSVEDNASDAAPAHKPNLWNRLRAGFRLDHSDHPGVQPFIDWYANNQDYLDRVVERARPFLHDILDEIERRGLPTEIALLPVVESAFQPFAYSPGRAAGIWQFIPATGRRYGLKQNWWYDGRRDVYASTRAALNYLSTLNKDFNGDWLLALAAYNSGEGRVLRAIRKNRRIGKKTDFWSLDLPAETRGYVPKLLAISSIVENAATYGVTLAPIPDEPYLARVNIDSQIDLALAADLADLTIEDIYQLNPAFNRWATDPKGPHVLSLPLDVADEFRAKLAQLKKRERIQWKRHRIRSGETLGQIAQRYQTSVRLLQDINNIRGKMIRAGHSLIIPVATKSLKHYLSEDRRRLAIQNAERQGEKVQHVVQAGDTLWDLSRAYKVNVRKLASWNAMSPRDPLMPGQRLVIWTREPRAVKTRFIKPPASARHQKVHYRVRKGDSLARIAQKFSVTVSLLRRWNDLPKGKYLQPGQRLTLYVDITQQS
jgi:membrane-bound lytic murein transglycosylase D